MKKIKNIFDIFDFKEHWHLKISRSIVHKDKYRQHEYDVITSETVALTEKLEMKKTGEENHFKTEEAALQYQAKIKSNIKTKPFRCWWKH